MNTPQKIPTDVVSPSSQHRSTHDDYDDDDDDDDDDDNDDDDDDDADKGDDCIGYWWPTGGLRILLKSSTASLGGGR